MEPEAPVYERIVLKVSGEAMHEHGGRDNISPTVVRSIAERAKAGDESLKAAPVHAPRRRLDETLAARKPVLTYRTPQAAEAAE